MASSPGLSGAPVTKAVLLATAGVSVLSQTYRHTPLSPLTSTLLRPLLLRTPSELCFGTYLLFNFHTLERQAGSGKHGSLLLLASAVSHAGQFLLSSTLGVKSAAGPYAAIYSMLVMFMIDIPPSTRFFVGGVPLTDKVFTYTAAAFLALQSGASFVSAACGLTAGLLMRSNLLGMAQFVLPRPLLRFISKTFGTLLDSQRPQVHLVYPGGQEPNNMPPGTAGGSTPARTPTPTPPMRSGSAHAMATAAAAVQVSEEALQQLVAMGFEQQRAENALRETNNNVQNALAILL